jgi:hypothetical protein
MIYREQNSGDDDAKRRIKKLAHSLLSFHQRRTTKKYTPASGIANRKHLLEFESYISASE